MGREQQEAISSPHWHIHPFAGMTRIRFKGSPRCNASGRADVWVAVAAAAIETPADTAAVAAASSDLGSLLLQNAQSAKAEPLLRDCLEQCFKQQPEHWLRFNIESLLGGALLQQKKYTEAGPLLQSGYEGLNARTQIGRASCRERVSSPV